MLFRPPAARGGSGPSCGFTRTNLPPETDDVGALGGVFAVGAAGPKQRKGQTLELPTSGPDPSPHPLAHVPRESLPRAAPPSFASHGVRREDPPPDLNPVAHS